MSNYKSCIVALLFFSNFISVKSYALEVYCPKLPFSNKIGEIYMGWEITYDWGNEPNFVNKHYQSYLGKEYSFKKWFSVQEINNNDDRTSLIMCCSSFGKNKMLCLSKKLKDRSCESLLFEEGRYAFKCQHKQK